MVACHVHVRLLGSSALPGSRTGDAVGFHNTGLPDHGIPAIWELLPFRLRRVSLGIRLSDEGTNSADGRDSSHS